MTKKLILLPFILLSQNLFANGNTGGMDGGGGGTLPANPATINQVRTIAQEAKPELLFLFNSYEYFGSISPDSLHTKLFGRSRVQDVLKELRLEVRVDKPCYTSKGTEVDASIYATKHNTICLSASRIAPKVDVAAAKREVIALLMHEVSHFMGATEEEAVNFQKEIAHSIQSSPVLPNYLNPQIKMHVQIELSTLASNLRDSSEYLKKKDFKTAEEKIFEVQNRLYKLSDFLRAGSPAYSFYSPQEISYQDFLGAQLEWAKKFALTLSFAPGSAAHLDYEAAFKGREFFLFGEKSYSKDNVYNSQKIYKIHSAQELIVYIEALAKEYYIRSTYAGQAVYGMRWINLNGHTATAINNPWKKYLGRYLVRSVECDYSNPNDNTTEFQVLEEGGRIYLNQVTTTGYSYNGLELGDYNVSAYLNVNDETAPGDVYAAYEIGGDWGAGPQSWSRVSVLRLKKNSDREFTIYRSHSYISSVVTEPDRASICVYKGVIQ
ncbi:hypothetical protein ACLVWU_17230 [Bdellovibrio sp. HCB290]|uniref:hypothetical protein n=1 Tax=Bdellovibrio sp. HCB290 TaxID=3394356 RepID=UPI0039B416B7